MRLGSGVLNPDTAVRHPFLGNSCSRGILSFGSRAGREDVGGGWVDGRVGGCNFHSENHILLELS